MLVIADTSPLIVLVSIGYVRVLPTLFGTVVIPPEVASELTDPKRPDAVRSFIQGQPAWLTVQAPQRNEAIPRLQPAETAAIHLAQELNAALLLIDEMQGRKAAMERQLKLTGTIGVLEMAASLKLLDLKEAFDLVKQTDFWISHKLLDERLKMFQQEE